MPSRMFVETIRSPGLAHLSYLVGHKGRAAVIDPRRDVEEYIRLAHQHEAAITHIFETHRNEDYVIGSLELARRTGATIHHGPRAEESYGQECHSGDAFEIGGIRLEVLETPGHTKDSISIAFYDTATSEEDAVAVFTGDALFVGDVGRTDFYPDDTREVAGMLYDSIFDTLLPLGDGVLLYPAHGAGSVCGSGMAARDVSSLGLERKTNPALQAESREAFIDRKTAEHHYKPPYFHQMEVYNQKGSAPLLEQVPLPRPMDPGAFAAAQQDGMVVLDVRSPEACAAACIPGSLALPLELVPSYAGWFLEYDQPIGLVVDCPSQVQTAVRDLLRIGYDKVVGYLDGLTDWETTGRRFEQLGSIHVQQIKERLDAGEEIVLLDVRKEEEVEQAAIRDAIHIYLGHLPGNLDEVPRDRLVVTFCGSGVRSTTAASILKQHDYPQVAVAMGSVQACKALGGILIES